MSEYIINSSINYMFQHYYTISRILLQTVTNVMHLGYGTMNYKITS